jgi:hypothetical protein
MLPVQSPFAKIFLFPFDPNHFYIPGHPGPTRQGRFAIVTNVRQGCSGRRRRVDEGAYSCGRRSRVVLTPRRWRQVGERDFTGDGDKKARSPGRARRKPLKPLRAGMPGDSGATVVTNARAYYSTRAAAGATGTRHSPLPAWGSPTPSSGESFKHNSGASRGELLMHVRFAFDIESGSAQR